MSLQMKDECQKCAAGLSPQDEAFICSYECTFCPSCYAEWKAVCPQLRRRAAGQAAAPELEDSFFILF